MIFKAILLIKNTHCEKPSDVFTFRLAMSSPLMQIKSEELRALNFYDDEQILGSDTLK